MDGRFSIPPARRAVQVLFCILFLLALNDPSSTSRAQANGPTFTFYDLGPATGGTYGVATGDLAGDGALDIVLGRWGDNSIYSNNWGNDFSYSTAFGDPKPGGADSEPILQNGFRDSDPDHEAGKDAEPRHEGILFIGSSLTCLLGVVHFGIASAFGGSDPCACFSRRLCRRLPINSTPFVHYGGKRQNSNEARRAVS